MGIVDSLKNDSRNKIFRTYRNYLISLSVREHCLSPTQIKDELRSIYELFGDLLGFSEVDIRRQYFEGTSKED